MDMGKYASLFENEPSTISKAQDLLMEQPHTLRVCNKHFFG